MTERPAKSDLRLRTDYEWTARQRAVLELIARGRSNLEISEELGISLAGAKWHVSEILSKLQAESRQEAADYWQKYNGWQLRFWRTFQGASIAAALKWVGFFAVAAGAATAAAIFLVRASTDDDDPSASAPSETTTRVAPTPTATTTATATEDPQSRWQFAPTSQCPIPDSSACAAATALREAVSAGDFNAVERLALPVEIVCPDVPDNLTSAVCSPPRGPGDRVAALGAGKWGGGAGLQQWDQTRQFLADSLAQASGGGGMPDVRVGGIGCAVQNATPDCSEFAVLLVVRHADADQVLQFAFRRAEGTVGFYGVVNSVPWESAYTSGEPYPATFGISPYRHAVPKISFQAWSP